MREIEQIDVQVIESLSNRRPVNDAAVKKVMESMGEIGLLTPITVRLVDNFKCADGEVADGVPVLVTGAHRLEAAKRLGWERIDCFYFNGEDELDAELWEIDENLMRAELTPSQVADHLKRRKEIWEAKRSAESGKTSPTLTGGRGNEGFAKETAEKTGVSKRSINQAISRAEKIPEPIRQKIEGTKLDTGSYMDSIKDLPEEEMEEMVAEDLKRSSMPKPQNPEAVKQDRIRRERERLMRAWNAASSEVREWFVSEIVEAA